MSDGNQQPPTSGGYATTVPGGSSLSTRINAAPFVPRSTPGMATSPPQDLATQQTMQLDNVVDRLRQDAPVFVPGGGGSAVRPDAPTPATWQAYQAAQQAAQQAASPNNLQAAVNATPFVPFTMQQQGALSQPPPIPQQQQQLSQPAAATLASYLQANRDALAAASAIQAALPSLGMSMRPPPPNTLPPNTLPPNTLPDSDDVLGMTAMAPPAAAGSLLSSLGIGGGVGGVGGGVGGGLRGGMLGTQPPPPPLHASPQRAAALHSNSQALNTQAVAAAAAAAAAAAVNNQRALLQQQQQQQPVVQPQTWGGFTANPNAPGRAPLMVGRGLGGRGGGRVPPPGRGGRGAGRSYLNAAGHLIAPGKMSLSARFMHEQLRNDLKHRAACIQAQLSPEEDPSMPLTIQQFHTVFPLEDTQAAMEVPSSVFGVSTLMLKGVHRVNGAAYALRRIEGGQVGLTPQLVAKAQRTIEAYAGCGSHPHVVVPRDVFVSNGVLGAPGLFFVYEYYPAAVTLEQAHMRPTATAAGLVRNAATEEQLWSYLVQLTSVLRAVHCNGGAVRAACLTPSKVLVTSAGRIRVGSLGIPETLSPDPIDTPQDIQQLQRADLTALGNLLLALACSGVASTPSVEVLASHFSQELARVAAGLVAGRVITTWQQLMAALGDRVYTELEASNAHADVLLTEMSKEVENGRLLRLMVKLAMVNERPPGDVLDDTWSDTGDRYLLKLFRDFVFHQVDDQGAPVTDMGYVVECLNKLDAGVHEKVLLMSRDEQSLLVASYYDVRGALEKAYGEVVQVEKTIRNRVRMEQQTPGGGV